jgi:hypothetical protein
MRTPTLATYEDARDKRRLYPNNPNLMKDLRMRFSLLFLFLTFTCLGAQSVWAADGKNPTTFQATDVFSADGLMSMTGAAWLIRSKNGFRGRIMSQVSDPGHAYTVWLVIFNNPGACVNGCNDEDLGNSAVQGAVFYGNAAISASDGVSGGVVNIDFETVADGIPDGTFRLDDLAPEPLFYQRGLRRGNGFGAEVHLVIDYHPGPAKDGTETWVPDLTTTNFPGGINTNHRFAVFTPLSP